MARFLRPPEALAAHNRGVVAGGTWAKPVCGVHGGEPLLQLDFSINNALHQADSKLALKPLVPAGAARNHWLCVSPKADCASVIERCNELKLCPTAKATPEALFCHHYSPIHFFLSPMASPSVPENQHGCNPSRAIRVRATDYCLANPRWA